MLFNGFKIVWIDLTTNMYYTYVVIHYSQLDVLIQGNSSICNITSLVQQLLPAWRHFIVKIDGIKAMISDQLNSKILSIQALTNQTS